MGLFKWFGSGKESPASMPWDSHPSIYEHVRSHIGPMGELDNAGETLPDEEKMAGNSQIRWAAGAMDGVSSHHMAGGADDEQVTTLAEKICSYCAAPTAQHKLQVYQCLVEAEGLSFIDPLLKSLREKVANPARLHDLALSLATESPDRSPVKFGIAVLGMFDVSEQKEILMALGRHDEFTLFCAVALLNGLETPEPALWELARHVHGWGRIHLVERLADTQDPKIKQWMLREGFRNSVMYEYLACICATAGGLLSALSDDDVDDALLLGAGEIIDALLNGGPAENIDDYDEGAAVIEWYLHHMTSRASTLLQFLTVSHIRNFLADETAPWEERELRGWSKAKRAELLDECNAIMSLPLWTKLVLGEQQTTDDGMFYSVKEAAKVLKIDLWQRLWDRAVAAPLSSGRWYDLMEACAGNRIDAVLELARRSLPLNQIGSGPASELGFGKKYEAHNCLDFILQGLGKYPGKGADLVEAGLRSPVIRGRNMAINALSEWGQQNWPAGTVDKLDAALSAEPEKAVRQRIEKILSR